MFDLPESQRSHSSNHCGTWIYETTEERGLRMRLASIAINNFRGVKHSRLIFTPQVVLVGDNNSGKSTILEAIDLVLGPERLSRHPVIDEHDFYAGQYLDRERRPVEITIEVIIIDLNEEQRVYFSNNLEWWDSEAKSLLEGPPPEMTDRDGVIPALRVGFRGFYDGEEDDFFGETFFLSPRSEENTREPFRLKDKRMCGFLYLRTLRTGSRALSLERGSLLDVILKLRELKPQMWEDVLAKLRGVSVADSPELGISGILTSVQEAVRKLVPVECADAPAMRVSQLTREHLRQILTVFLGTGTCDDSGSEYTAPFHHQGTGTINTLVLALLSMIADLKQNVIFAMEEPEIAIPPHTQKRVINSVIDKAAQAIFTSHSPYVLEEFEPAHILVLNRKDGELIGTPATYPSSVKPKRYREEARRRCEALLARRVLIVEGSTEYDTFSSVAEKLDKTMPDEYASLEGLGIAVISADTDSQIAPLGEYFRGLGKIVYAIFDKQEEAALNKITANVDHLYESPEMGFEDLVLNETSEEAIRRFARSLLNGGLWPVHFGPISPSDMPIADLNRSLKKYFQHKKADGDIADFLDACSVTEIPAYIRDTLRAIRDTVIPSGGCTEEEAEVEDTGVSN